MNAGEPSPRSDTSHGLANSRRTLSRGLLLATIAALSACGPVRRTTDGPTPAPPPPRAQIGRITEAVGAVTLSRGAATAGAPIFHGDKVSTGAGSYATAELFGYGVLDLGESTDPRFSLRQDGCLLIQFLFGWANLNGSRFCVIEPGGAEIFFSTRALIHAAGPRTVVMVFQGSARVRGRVVGPGQQLIITGGVPGPVGSVDKRELSTYLRRFRRPPTTDGGAGTIR